MSHPVRHASLAALSVGAGLALALVGTGTALGITGCRGDPVVTLSNGMKVRLWTVIATDASQVNNVAYTLHVPQGLSVTNVQFDNGPVPETFNWVADRPPVENNGNVQLTSETQASTTSSAGVTVNAYGLDGAVESGASKDGETGHAIRQNFQLQPLQGKSKCMGDFTLTGSVPKDLVVPSGVTCTVNNLSVAGNVRVQSGGTLIATGLLVGQDLQAQQAADVQLTGGSVGHDAQLQGLIGGSSSLCGVTITNNLTIQNMDQSASMSLGNPNNGCPGNTVGGALQLQNNQGTATAVGNSVQGNAQCDGNDWTTLNESGNTIYGDNQGC